MDTIGYSKMKSIKRLWHYFEWPVVGFLGFIVLLIGYIGFRSYWTSLGEVRSHSDVLYQSLQLFVLESGSVKGPVNVYLQSARWFAPAIAAYTAFQAFTVIFREQIAILRMLRLHNHVIICGLGQKGFLIAKRYDDQGTRVIIIENNEANDLIGVCKDLGMIVLTGNATNLEVLQRARVKNAKHLIAVTGDDGVNAEVAVNARCLVVKDRKGKDRKKKDRKRHPLNCIIHICEPQLYNLLREREIATELVDAFRLDFFNVYEFGAQVWLEQFPIMKADSKMHDGEVHILLIGLGRMGESLLSTAARQWWHKYMHYQTKPKMKFTIIDRDAERKTALICIKYPRIQEVCEFNPIKIELNAPDFQNGEFLFDSNRHCKFKAIFVCLHDENRCLITSLSLYHHLRMHKIPIIVRMDHGTGLATLIRGETPYDKEQSGEATSENAQADSFHNLHALVLLDSTCKPELILRGSTHEILARVIHEEYLADRNNKGETPEQNKAMVPWDELLDYLKESNRQQADYIGLRLKKIDCEITPLLDWREPLFQFSSKEIEELAPMEHQRWLEERLADGWKHSVGPKDIKNKLSPLLVEWKHLPEESKDFARDTIRKIPHLLAKTGFKIIKRNPQQA
ncbi:MAG: NAD-binding protein [Syntrophaceae bacterium]|nr:NAD-binding protein [Syntrophaceae bacterium]